MPGTVLNVIAVFIGGSIGTFFGNRLPAKVQETVLHGDYELLAIKSAKVRVANLLPSIAIAPLLVWLLGSSGIGF